MIAPCCLMIKPFLEEISISRWTKAVYERFYSLLVSEQCLIRDSFYVFLYIFFCFPQSSLAEGFLYG